MHIFKILIYSTSATVESLQKYTWILYWMLSDMCVLNILNYYKSNKWNALAFSTIAFFGNNIFKSDLFRNLIKTLLQCEGHT